MSMDSGNLRGNEPLHDLATRSGWCIRGAGKGTFWQEWGGWLGLGLILALLFFSVTLPLMEQGSADQGKTYPLQFIKAFFLLYVTGAVIWCAILVIGWPRITLAESMILVLQASCLTLMLVRFELIELLPGGPVQQYGLFFLAQIIYLAVFARVIHWAAGREEVRRWRGRASPPPPIETAWRPALLFPLSFTGATLFAAVLFKFFLLCLMLIGLVVLLHVLINDKSNVRRRPLRASRSSVRRRVPLKP